MNVIDIDVSARMTRDATASKLDTIMNACYSVVTLNVVRSAAKEGEAEAGGAEGQEALVQRDAADAAALQRQQQQRRPGDFRRHVGCDGGGSSGSYGGPRSGRHFVRGVLSL